ncbi:MULTISPECIES: GNAT family N-acetyltransferase [unclassified Paenibacillus]|uniref:GNAT family N-acetyltransferase n=1 Tax=unclassified Paenibacillus TaxID=185978 RepID=UPI002404C5B7|nr:MULTISPECIES: GNAT family N-acetyltransferase [unclassified Paenibacillus]MDF9843595.1 putative acetyltransferase [Paenibacillus sp. PastF-2]MDF9850184.1 putative acetyltransferase [Paenibacillus sp. PastM-2]MDF9856876.1 putative acetyltransferase [Paenibacillus sp. PastF-1]MDH6482031.1 putative acetyltransferase [Paenibacillus sp. PastH-2]MDH6509455.1 putative acetyltransferase [Paenibacillus sp. PastM-3]
MKIRTFTEQDIAQIVTLFYETVHSVNKRDYSQEQLNAWASYEDESQRLSTWKDALSRNITLVVENNGVIAGFADMTAQGYLDRLFVHKEYQRQGIASALVNTLEAEAHRLDLTEIRTEASITAKPYFEQAGFEVVRQQVVERKGVKLENYIMVKSLR